MDNNLIVYIITLDEEKEFYELIVENREYAYSIRFIDVDREITKNNITQQ